MAQVVLHIEDGSKLQSFLDWVQKMAYVKVEKVIDEKDSGEDDFFALSGMWKDKDIDAEKIRKQAWSLKK